MMMAPIMQGQVGQMEQQDIKGRMGMPQYWAPPDERDAYIGWLRSEFAAANALIDSMCHHLHSIGGLGEYEVVFGCLNRRRHAWTPSLYMQSFFSVAEVVSALQDVAWKRQHGHHADVTVKACPSCQVQGEEAAPAQLGNSNTHLNVMDGSAAESQQHEPFTNGCLSISNTDEIDGSYTTGTEAAETSLSLLTSAEACIIGCDKKTPPRTRSKPTSSMAHMNRKGRQQVVSANNTKGDMSDEPSLLLNINGLDVKQLLNTELSIASKEEDARHAIIKRSMQFQCCEHVDGHQVNGGESVELCEHVFNNREIDEIVGIVGQLRAAGQQGELGCAFGGCKKSSRLPDIIQFGPNIDNRTCLPRFLQAIIRWLTSCGILSPKKSPDSCCISIFDKGSFEAPNTDQGAWEKPLCVMSLMEDCSMVFGHSITTDECGSCNAPFQVTLPAGSVMLLRENFTGILQKAIPASPSKRITIALGKAASISSAEVGKKYRGTGADKQHLFALPHLQFPLAFVQPSNVPGFMLPPPPAVVLPTSSAGTGVFFPSCDASVSPCQSAVLLLSSSSPLAVHSRRAGKHVGASQAHALAPKQTLAPCQHVA